MCVCCVRVHAYARTGVHGHVHAYTRVRARAHGRAHAQAHIHTHPHTHTQRAISSDFEYIVWECLKLVKSSMHASDIIGSIMAEQ